MARKNKERKKINPFDVAVILLLICLVATFAYRVYAGISADDPENKEVKYIMEFTCEEEYDSILSYLAPGDAVYFGDEKLLGFLYAGEEENAVYAVVDPDHMQSPAPDGNGGETAGEVKLYTPIRLEGRISLNGETVRVKNGNYYSIGGTNLTVGGKLHVYTEKADFTLVVRSITIAEE